MAVSQQSNNDQEEDDEHPEDNLHLPVPKDSSPVASVVRISGPGATAQTSEAWWHLYTRLYGYNCEYCTQNGYNCEYCTQNGL